MNEVNKRKMYFLWFRPIAYNGADLRKLRNMVFNDLLNVRLHFWGNITGRNLFKQRTLS
jgi:hypothetical protein